jgi:hypothetical protein
MRDKTQVIDLAQYRCHREVIADFARQAMGPDSGPAAASTFQTAARAVMTQAGSRRMQFQGFSVALVGGQAMIRGRGR